jgi:hypothetical protein
MQRRWVQLVALLTVIVASLNAQCIISCSIPAFASSPSAQNAPEVSEQGNHACCPGHRHSGNTKQTPHDSCSQVSVHASPAPAPIAIGVAVVPQLIPAQFDFSPRFEPVTDLPEPDHRSSIHILRI